MSEYQGAKYNYHKLKREHPFSGPALPEDVNDQVIEKITPILDKFPEVKKSALKMIEEARLKKKYTDKTRANIFRPGFVLPLIVLEFHHGIVKQFSFAEFFGESCYFPINNFNKRVAFSKE